MACPTAPRCRGRWRRAACASDIRERRVLRREPVDGHVRGLWRRGQPAPFVSPVARQRNGVVLPAWQKLAQKGGGAGAEGVRKNASAAVQHMQAAKSQPTLPLRPAPATFCTPASCGRVVKISSTCTGRRWGVIGLPARAPTSSSAAAATSEAVISTCERPFFWVAGG